MRFIASLTILISVGCTAEILDPGDEDPSAVEPGDITAAGTLGETPKPKRPRRADAGVIVQPTPDAAPVPAPDASLPALPDAAAPMPPDATPPPPFTYELAVDPLRTIVRDAGGAWVATFTHGARTVRLAGPSRTFTETLAPDPVTHTTWVRVLAAPFDGIVDEAWLLAQCGSTEPDLLTLAMQYIDGAPAIFDGPLQIAGDACYGPLVNGSRQEGSDFNDYLGLDWVYADGTDYNEVAQLGCLDCSGYVRMIFGYRSGLPMVGSVDAGGVALPRRAVQMAASAMGVLVIPEVSGVTAPLAGLEIGDLVFFDVSTDDGADIDHVGVYLGVDAAGHERFLSSRKGINGPTFGDYNGTSRLDGTGLYATGFRAARRL